MNHPAMPITELDKLSFELLHQKSLEDKARKARLEIEKAIDSILGHKEEGTITQETGFYKISTVAGMTRTITDYHTLQSIAPQAIRVKSEIDTKAVKAIQSANPELYAQVARCIEAKPRKISVKVEELKQ